MTARELLTQLKEKSIDVKANGDRLIIDAPKGTVTPELRAALAEHKAELLKILNTPPVEEPLLPVKIATPVAEAAAETRPISRAREVATSSIEEEIKTLQDEVTRLRAEEAARRAEVETARLAAEHAFHQERERARQEQEGAARRRAEQEKLRIEAEARERARDAFMKHGYFDDATRDLRVAESANERAAAARRLSFVRNQEATPHLTAALDDSSPDVRRAAVEALMDLRDPSAIAPLNSLMQTETDRKVPRSLIKHAIEACATTAPDDAAPTPDVNSFPAAASASSPAETEREVIEI